MDENTKGIGNSREESTVPTQGKLGADTRTAIESVEERLIDSELNVRFFEAETNLLSDMDSQVVMSEDEFFEDVREALNNLCEHISNAVEADSAAIFFVNEEAAIPELVMRGATGRLRRTLDRHDVWRETLARRAEPTPAELKKEPEGVRYPSRVEDEQWKEASPTVRRVQLREWDVANQVWHLARGRIANSNQAMDLMHGGVRCEGMGDSNAYPSQSLRDAFRSFVGVPVFVRRGLTENFDIESPSGGENSLREKFLSNYRVVGILKVEGRRPAIRPSEEEIREAVFSESRGQSTVFDVPGNPEDEPGLDLLEEWISKVAEEFAKDPANFPDVKFPQTIKKGQIDALTDRLTQCCRAKFTGNDIEILGLFAMQIGRAIGPRVLRRIENLNLLKKPAEATRKSIVCEADDEAIQSEIETSSEFGGMEERQLLSSVNRGLPKQFWIEYRGLTEKLESGDLGGEENARLIEMADQIEQAEAERFAAAAELAKRRSVTFDQIIGEFQIAATVH